MAEIRLNKIIRKFNIGLDDLVNFLQKIGVEIDANPNAKIDESYMTAISKQFGKDLKIKEEAEKVDIKMKEIIEKGRKQPKEEESDDEPEHETIIKSNTLSDVKPVEVRKAPEAVNPVESHKGQQVPEVTEPQTAPEQKVEPQPEKPVPVVEAVPVVVSTPEVKAEPQPEKPEEVKVKPKPVVEHKVQEEPKTRKESAPVNKEEPKPVVVENAVKIEPAEAVPGTQFKVVGKIDLSQFDRKPSKKRERVTKGTQKVDVAKAGAHVEKSQKKDRKQDQKQGGQPRQDQKNKQNASQPNAQANPGKGRTCHD